MVYGASTNKPIAVIKGHNNLLPQLADSMQTSLKRMRNKALTVTVTEVTPAQK